MTRPIGSIDQLFVVLERGRATEDDEALDLLAHSLQCAAQLTQTAPDDVELQVAGLVHDLGTLLPEGRADTHAVVGATAVAPLLGDRVARLVGLHDAAKRYLVTVEPRYRQSLSERSIETLREQGGLMDAEERRAFEGTQYFAELLTLRRADDAAKQPGRTVPGLDEWRDAAETVARSAASLKV